MRLYRNILHLFLWQGSHYLVPLILTPYLTRVLGLESYGVLGIALALTAYGTMLTDWGFTLSATQKIARASDDPELLRKLFWGTLNAKILLSLLSLLLLGLVILLIPSFRAIWPTVLASSIAIVATAFSTSWFLQGLEYMGAFAASALIGRFLGLPLTLILVHKPEDVVIAAAIQGATQLISAVVSIVISARLVRLAPFEWDMGCALRQIHDGWLQFASSLSVSLYTQLNAVFVGFISGPTQAGLLTGSQRILQGFMGFAIPINMAVYPRINRLTDQDPRGAIKMMLKVLGVQTAVAVCASAGMYVIAPYIVPIFLGGDFSGAVPVVRTLAFMPFLAGITNVLGSNVMLPLGLKFSYTVLLALAGVVNGFFLLLLSRHLGAVGGATSAVITEIFLASTMAGAIYWKRSVIERMERGESPEPN